MTKDQKEKKFYQNLRKLLSKIMNARKQKVKVNIV